MGSIVGLVIVLSPIFFYTYLSFPDSKVWETFLFTYESKYFNSVQTLAWVMQGKLIPFCLLLIWFFTSKNWWSPAILAPVGMYLYQMVNILNDDVKLKDEAIDNLILVPIILLCCFVLFQARRKLSFYLNAFDLKESITKEISKVKDEIGNGRR